MCLMLYVLFYVFELIFWVYIVFIYYLTVYILYISRVNKQHTPSYFFFASDKVYQLFSHGQWFSQGTPASSIT